MNNHQQRKDAQDPLGRPDPQPASGPGTPPVPEPEALSVRKPADDPVLKSQPIREPKLVRRVTALHGPDEDEPLLTSESTLRRRCLRDLRSMDPEIPFGKYEAAARDLVCSLMVRQDRMTEAIFNKLIDLEYRISDLETDIAELKEKRRQ